MANVDMEEATFSDDEQEEEENDDSDDSNDVPPSPLAEGQPEDMDDQDDVDDETLKQLEKDVASNPNKYEAHVALIAALRKSGELEKIREARQRFAAVFPLSPKLWLQWINDERRIDTPWEELKELFEKAVQDYLSVQVWLEYVQVACGNLGPEEMRELCERALSRVGLHVADGRLLWDAYRVLEGALSEASRTADTPPDTDRLFHLYKRQLSIPLMGLEETRQEFLEVFGEEKYDSAMAQAYKLAFEELQTLAVFEKELQSSNYTPEAYSRYLDFEEGHREGAQSAEGHKEKEKTKEKSAPNIARLQCLYERAITDRCLDVGLWHRYLAWLDKRFTSSMSITEVVLPVYERAVRNCPWMPSLWSKYALAYERSGVADWCEKADTVLTRALGSMEAPYTSANDVSELWMTWAYQKRRAADAGLCSYEKAAEVFENGANFLKQSYGDRYWDPSAVYRRTWASFLALQSKKIGNDGVVAKEMAKAREIWKDILASDGNGRLATAWLEYYQFERRFGDVKETRKALFNALNSVTDFPDSITAMLKQFELEEGTLRDLDEAEERIRRQKARLEERKLQQHALTTSKQQQQYGGQRKEAYGQRLPRNDKNAKGNFGKRKDFEADQTSASPAKKVRFEPPAATAVKQQPAPAPEKREVKKASDLPESERRRRTIFVSNLNFSLSEDQLKEVFDGLEVGPVAEVRLMKLNPGRSRGFGYVEFESPESVAKALTKDRHLIDGRPMYVSEYKERGGGDLATNRMEKAAGVGQKNAAAEKYHFGAGPEKNKLFVRNIPKHAGEADLRTIFEPFGSLKSIRLVTFPSGQSKGMAYIEYGDEESAAKALASTDGQVLFEKQLSVAISNPPPRRTGPFSGHAQPIQRPFHQQQRQQGQHTTPDQRMMPPPSTTSLVPRVLGGGGSKSRLNLK